MAPWKYHAMMAWRFKSVLRKAFELRNGCPDFELFSFPFSACSVEDHPLIEWADIIHLHWVAHFVNYPTFFNRIRKPIVWTLHDMHPYLGGFHYAGDALRHPWALEQRFKQEKAKIMQQTENLSVVAISHQYKELSAASETFHGRPHHVIPLGVDMTVFSPQPQEAARARFNIPHDKCVLLFVTQPSSAAAHRKGIDLLEQNIEHFHAMGLHLCGIGAFNNTHIQSIPPMPQSDLAALYSAADFLIAPSREDCAPTTMPEAMACGTPVIGTPVGMMRDFIRTGETGVLAKDTSAEALLAAVQEATTQHTFDRTQVRTFAENHFALEQQLRSYCDLYREVLKYTPEGLCNNETHLY